MTAGMRMGRAENIARFKELVLYISQKCVADEKFTVLKLNKLMFFADFLSYAIYGEPITSFEYVKLEKGPAPRKMPDIRNEMIAGGELGMQELPLTPWKRTVNLRRPDLSVFRPEHIALVDALIESFGKHDGNILSGMTHKMPCWILPDLYETIPYETVFISEEPLTEADKSRGWAVAQELGLLEQA
jgi:hypothetical protein